MQALKPLEGSTIGEGACTLCGGRVNVKVNKSGHIYYYCRGDDCVHEDRAGSDVADKVMAAKVIKKWRKPEARKILTADDEDDTVFEVEIEE